MKRDAPHKTRLIAALVCAAALIGATPVPQNSADTLDFGQAAQWEQGRRPPPRQADVQLMIIDIIDVEVPGQLQARDMPAPSPFPWLLSSVWNLVSGVRSSASETFRAPSLWLYPIFGGGQGVTRAARVHAYLTSLGNSTGEAFDIQLVNDGPTPIRIGGDGVVVEPIRKGSDKDLRAELQQIASRRAPTTVKANAYCLEFKLKPPDQGSMFRVSDPATQQKYSAAREILRASRRLQQNGALVADSNPADYFHAIRQWALWTSEQRFTVASYRDAFIARSRKNAEALGQRWTREIEDALKGLVPHRWDDITKILAEARQPVPAR